MQSASLAIVVNGHVLVACRSKQQKVGPGLWQLPGGKVENEESPLDATLREMKEEFGLRLDTAQIERIGTVSSNALGAKKKSLIKVSLYYCEMSERPELRLESSISSVSWPSPSAISSCNLDLLGDNLTMLRLVRRYHFSYRPPCPSTTSCQQQLPGSPTLCPISTRICPISPRNRLRRSTPSSTYSDS